MNTYCGIDFGTSNSTVGLCDRAGPRLLALENGQPTLPSAIFYDLEDKLVRFGRDAMLAYTEAHDGRLLRALKSILGSGLIDESTQVGEARIPFSSIIGEFLAQLKYLAEADIDAPLDTVVMGRPVHFADGDTKADARAQNQLEAIVREQGFRHVEFQFEPVAAALAYESTLASEELVLVCDIGGGTSDFSLVRVGPSHAGKADRARDILANTGVHVGGTDLDFRLSLSRVMPLLGLGSRLALSSGGEASLPVWPYHDLATWHRIVFLYTPKILADLKDIRRIALSPALVDRLIEVVAERQGHLMASRVEAAKVELSAAPAAQIDLGFIEDGLFADATLTDLEASIGGEVRSMEAAILDCTHAAGIAPDEIDAVFLTGGSTALPLVYSACTRLAAKARIVEGDRFGSVGLGLALDAAARFGA
jgi:hypothetical chaperone protein